MYSINHSKDSFSGGRAFLFEYSFSSRSLSGSYGGGMRCYCVPDKFNMRSVQFISCNATARGGGLDFEPYQTTAPSNNIYCYFFFFHDCSCNASTPYGHDVDNYRVCYEYLQSGSWKYQHTEKKDWLKEGMKDRYVGVGGDDASNLCRMSESAPCKTVGHAVGSSMAQLSSTITVLGGKHASEGTTINVGEKKIVITGRGKAVSVI
ncbi:uncharacterized protein MONOS_1186 [Monocercomonoides exilis]|uniref:uncharacterized protein n=1 Tax=Monocercomonoides exilis TaxID=2049356 RepID=UPI00355A3E4F|nr:hypothetical protein MONOS_1186 [Monocercomonoides exilis]|eukprot:MONOS_1186.1-p1 / transcript=MONOS_1186.1 / gene=MONOS_1186 / organism=Monocercomonoides_exilis_PA203 / gene_product=unspecified product / transcript_product=unspecified product / location=Mono_scaffold00020:88769-89660(+) / protein_length=206 / sequence_SO=supercontig / SO=protein_coding / is_pseudo=false